LYVDNKVSASIGDMEILVIIAVVKIAVVVIFSLHLQVKRMGFAVDGPAI